MNVIQRTVLISPQVILLPNATLPLLLLLAGFTILFFFLSHCRNECALAPCHLVSRSQLLLSEVNGLRCE